MKRIEEERPEEEVPMREFTLHNYNLKDLQKAYTIYKEARKGIVYAARELERYKIMKDGEEIKISEKQITAEIRQNPKLENVARIIEDPMTYALIRMLITYEKYNYETELEGIQMTMN